MKTLNTALAVACLLGAPTVAVAASSQEGDVEIVALAPAPHAREHIELRMSTAGVDLRDPQSLERLRARVSKAIETACNPGNRLNADRTPDWQCRQEMGASATATLHSLARQAAPQRLASN